MELKMKVHALRTNEVAATVQMNGVDVEAKVPQFEVELVDPTGQHGTVTLRFRSPEERAEAAEKFEQDGDATLSF